MADVENRSIPFERSASEQRLAERRTAAPAVTRVELAPPVARLSWSGVWGGFLIALGIYLVLATLGAAVTLSSGGAASAPNGAAMGKVMTAWLYVSALIALFFGSVFGARLALLVDGAIAWLEATLIWTFALVLTTLVAAAVLGVAAAYPEAVRAALQSSPAATNIGVLRASAWLTFIGMVVAWIVTVLGSFWGRAQARGRAHALGLGWAA
jgi:hypothetical protein